MSTGRSILRSKSCSARVRGVSVNEAGAPPPQAPQDGTSLADTVHWAFIVWVARSRSRGSGSGALAGAGGRTDGDTATGGGAATDAGRDVSRSGTPNATVVTTRPQ